MTTSKTMSNEELAERIEQLVDTRSVASVLCVLAEVCQGKAEHVATNWQDKTLAKEWRRLAKMVETLAFKAHL